jgi:nucleotide-binding universal stress UspA family protein
MYQTILVPGDGSNRDEVIDVAKYHNEFEKQKKRSQTYLTSLQNEFDKHGIQAETRLAYGSVVKAILKTATDTGTNLIAMATHGLSGLRRVSPMEAWRPVYSRRPNFLFC